MITAKRRRGNPLSKGLASRTHPRKSREKDICHLYLANCVNKIHYLHFCLFEHSSLYQWLELYIRKYQEQGKIAFYRRLWYLIHLWYRWDHCKTWFLFRELPLNVSHIILSWNPLLLLSDFKVQRLRSVPTPPVVVYTEFFHTDAETNIHPLLVSRDFKSSSLC